MNVVVITGGLGRDPKWIRTEHRGPMATFDVAVATDEGVEVAVLKQDGKTFWVPVGVHGPDMLEIATGLVKGDRVLVHGKLAPLGTAGRMEVLVGPGDRLERIPK